MTKPIKMTNAQLKKLYLKFNKRFFDNRLDKDMVVTFEHDLEDEETGQELNGIQFGDEVILNESLKLVGMDYISIILLHEMVHADLPDYNPADIHGPLFQAKVVRLFEKGAYDGLL